MGYSEKRDTCDWCGQGTNKLQIRGGSSVGLCPSCCPDIDATELPDTETLPPQWHYWDEREQARWLDGESAEDIVLDAYYDAV